MSRYHLLTGIITIISWIFVIIIALALVAPLFAQNPDWETYHQHIGSIPSESRGNLQFITLHPTPPDQRDKLLALLRFVVSTHSRQPIVEHSVPAPISETLLVLDLEALKWQHLPKMLANSYPYYRHHGRIPAIIRADWFITYLLDQTESKQLANLLIFGQEVKTEKEFWRLLGASNKKPLTWIEDNSGVALQKTRTINLVETSNRYPLWYTRDVRELNKDNDPFERLLEEKENHDASELIGGIRRQILSSGEHCLSQVYFLANGEGAIQFAAPIGIVSAGDKGPRGQELICSASCITCHNGGLNQPQLNALRTFLDTGALVAVKSQRDQLEIQARYLGRLDRTMKRWDEDAAIHIEATYGGDPSTLSDEVRALFADYDSPVTLERAATELYTTPANLNDLLIQHQVVRSLPARVVGLARGLPIARTQFEQHWAALYNLLYPRKVK